MSEQSKSQSTHLLGTAVFSYGVTDGPATRMTLISNTSDGGQVNIFVHDFGPKALTGSLTISDKYYLRNSAQMKFCGGGSAAPCSTVTEGTLTVEGNSGRALRGILRFRGANADWREMSFEARIVQSP